MARRSALLLLAAVFAVVLAGCGLKSPDELYSLPQPTAEYESLQTSLTELTGRGYEYSAPIAGSNTQSVQLEDLDGDGTDEAVAFFRDTSGAERPLKICIFRSDGEDGYRQVCMIEGEGDAINSVVYCQLNDPEISPSKEIVVGWRISSTVYALAAYSIENDNVTQLMSAPSYTSYAVRDLDQDNQAEIVAIQINTAEEGGNTATYYDWADDTMMGVNTVHLSASMGTLESIRYNYLEHNYPALFVSGYLQEDSSTLLTDILALNGGVLTNITLPKDAVDSNTAHLKLADPRDINGDNVLELPISQPLASSSAVERSDSFYILNWMQYGLNGSTGRSVGYTYHNTADGWYLNLPEHWVNHLILSRSEINVGATVERSITFYYQRDEEAEPEAFLTIYRNSGTNRVSRSTMAERFLVLEDDDASYSAEFYDCAWDCGLNEKSLIQQFHLILTDWSTD